MLGLQCSSGSRQPTFHDNSDSIQLVLPLSSSCRFAATLLILQESAQILENGVFQPVLKNRDDLRSERLMGGKYAVRDTDPVSESSTRSTSVESQNCAQIYVCNPIATHVDGSG